MNKVLNAILFRGRHYGDEKYIKIYIDNILPIELVDRYCIIYKGIDLTRKNDLHITVYVICEKDEVKNVKLYERIMISKYCTVGVEWVIVDI